MALILTKQDVQAVVTSIIGSRLGLSQVETAGIEAYTPIDEDGLGADSLELTELATHVSRFFRLHETGLEDNLLRWRTIESWTETVLESWEHSEERRVTFLTSGSTGQPEECAHEWRLLAQEIQALAGLFPDSTRVLGTVPRHHIYGFLWTILLPRYLGVPFFEARDMLPTSLVRSLRRGDLLVSFPLRWDQLAKAGLAFPQGVEGVTSTGPCPPALISALHALSLKRMVEVYGSTETAGIGWREDPVEPYRLLPYWSLAGGRLVREGPDGGPGSPVAAPDRLVERSGGFVVAERRDHAVQVGGVNVFPGRVAEIVRSHPDVADCEVRLMRPEEGQQLKAFVVPKEDEWGAADDIRRKLDRWLREKLSAPERPRSLTFGADIPRDEQGKLTDWS